MAAAWSLSTSVTPRQNGALTAKGAMWKTASSFPISSKNSACPLYIPLDRRSGLEKRASFDLLLPPPSSFESLHLQFIVVFCQRNSCKLRDGRATPRGNKASALFQPTDATLIHSGAGVLRRCPSGGAAVLRLSGGRSTEECRRLSQTGHARNLLGHQLTRVPPPTSVESRSQPATQFSQLAAPPLPLREGYIGK